MKNSENEIVKSELLVVTGMSGAGKSLVIQSLEDMGFFCVDNLPPVLLPKFVELMEQGNPSLQKVAIAIDLRGKELFKSLIKEIDIIKSRNDVIVDVMFLEAKTEKLISRYKESRRAHPLNENGQRSLIEAINEEREHLSEIRSIANFVIDTTLLKPKELKHRIAKFYLDDNFETFTINVTSFGFKHGIQMDADLVFDVRFLPNPYYVEELRPLTGLDDLVYNYVMKWKETEIFFDKLTDLLKYMIPGYKKEGKSQLVIAIGCTGGQHRSVALAKRLGEYLDEVFDYNVYVHHRDAHIESGEKKLKQMKVVLIGGGTGLSVLARGLREFPIDITAIVTVADNGGSTGKIRDVMDIPAPGDIRNVIAALSDSESTLTQLFQYRFDENKVDGHSIGNLVIAGMTSITNDFGHAIKELSKVLNIKGQVIPSTNTSVQLNAVMEDGEIVRGETNIPKTNKKIDRVFLEPGDVEPMEEAVEALEHADLIVLGPGSLYTSVISNLCVKGISEALLRSNAPKLYVSNVMTQPGETDNYGVKEHIDAICQQVGEDFIDFVICSNENYSKDVLRKYEEKIQNQ